MTDSSRPRARKLPAGPRSRAGSRPRSRGRSRLLRHSSRARSVMRSIARWSRAVGRRSSRAAVSEASSRAVLPSRRREAPGGGDRELDVAAGEAGGALGERPVVGDRALELVLAHRDLEDLLARRLVGHEDRDLDVGAPGAAHGGVDEVHAVRDVDAQDLAAERAVAPEVEGGRAHALAHAGVARSPASRLPPSAWSDSSTITITGARARMAAKAFSWLRSDWPTYICRERPEADAEHPALLGEALREVALARARAGP